mmetsp:Transcript_4046/g.16201  ORF Transcript_4046/g.16201 Transcript_4046/m.16201 type:complete len:262 (-) Transcript_4046:400-1185(-)
MAPSTTRSASILATPVSKSSSEKRSSVDSSTVMPASSSTILGNRLAPRSCTMMLPGCRSACMWLSMSIILSRHDSPRRASAALMGWPGIAMYSLMGTAFSKVSTNTAAELSVRSGRGKVTLRQRRKFRRKASSSTASDWKSSCCASAASKCWVVSPRRAHSLGRSFDAVATSWLSNMQSDSRLSTTHGWRTLTATTRSEGSDTPSLAPPSTQSHSFWKSVRSAAYAARSSRVARRATSSRSLARYTWPIEPLATGWWSNSS